MVADPGAVNTDPNSTLKEKNEIGPGSDRKKDPEPCLLHKELCCLNWIRFNLDPASELVAGIQIRILIVDR